MLIEKLKQKKIKSELYLKRYIKFINYYIENNTNENYEKHHILPRKLFPEYIKSEWNLVKLPYRAHYLAHYMLAKIFGSSMWYAFNSMNNKNYKKISHINSTLYSKGKKESSILLSELRKKEGKWIGNKNPSIKNPKFGNKNGMFNKEHTKESKEKMSDNWNKSGIRETWNKGKKTGPLSEEHKNNISKGSKGKPKSEEWKQKMRKPQKIIKCPHCSKTGGNSMKRWHFDNCKFKQTLSKN